MTKRTELKKEWLKRPDVKAEYYALAEEFSVAEALIRAQADVDMTQDHVDKSRLH